MSTIKTHKCPGCHQPCHLSPVLQYPENIDPALSQCTQENVIDNLPYNDICNSCFNQEKAMHTIGFAVEEAMFREQQDIHKWTAARWLLERGGFRARRVERLMREGGR